MEIPIKFLFKIVYLFAWNINILISSSWNSGILTLIVWTAIVTTRLIRYCAHVALVTMASNSLLKLQDILQSIDNGVLAPVNISQFQNRAMQHPKSFAENLA